MCENIDTNELVDITTVNVDKSLPQRERCADFNKQIKNMNFYRQGDMTISAIYANDGTSLEDCLRGMMT